MKCEICGVGMPEMATLHRVNEFGVKGIRRCWNCLTPEQRRAVDPIVKDITDTIEKGSHEHD